MNFKDIEGKWQKRWEEARIFEAEPDGKRKKFFITIPYPYVNGAPHLGHAYSFMRADTYARFKRMQGFNVLFPQGFHATGEPILGVVERIRNGDGDQIEALKNLGASDADIEDFGKKGPEFVANYWMKRWMDVLRSAGYSADWRRSFITAITPTYNRFIQWQYNTLRRKGYVVQGTHPVVWCPHDQSPTGDHDRLVGEGEGPTEYTMIKFTLDNGDVLPCATMRPETAYGATNVWMNPSGKYVRAVVDGENWIVGEEAIAKIADQLHKVEVKSDVSGSDVIGMKARNPVTGDSILVLPASFVDPKTATGVVMSVPSHAPYDWMGLHDLKENPDEAVRHGIDKNELQSIVPISIINVPGMSDHPAIEVTSRMLVSSQSETDKLDEATDEVYKKEFHSGVLKSNTDYPGMKVSDAKDKITEDFIKKGVATKFWETSAEVVCRCKTTCHIKVLENQWFLKFSDEKWKASVKDAIGKMSFYPDIARTQFVNTVDWLKDKACARKSGLGTKLPWDDAWIVETLSDSVIYMAYYTVAHVIKDNEVKPEQMSDEVLDYVFLGKGDVKSACKKSGLDPKIAQHMRDQFSYFYPVDIRFSGKDLIQNHLTYFLFHHTAIWDEPSMWPRSVAANGYVTLKGQKMSKRFGNVKRLADLVAEHGADICRLNLAGANENMDDADWREEGVEAFNQRISQIVKTVESSRRAKRESRWLADDYIVSRMQRIIERTTEACEETKFRSAIQSATFESTNELKWYIDRCGGVENCNHKVLSEVLSTIVRLNAPFMPHVAEEIWESMGHDEMIATSDWPKADERLVNEKSELGESIVAKTLADVREIQKISGIKEPKGVTIIVAPQWKFDVYKIVMENKREDFKKVLSMVKEKNESTVKYIQMLQKKANELPEIIVQRNDQIKLLNEAEKFMIQQLGMKVTIEDAESSKLEKARNADVGKPAIVLV